VGRTSAGCREPPSRDGGTAASRAGTAAREGTKSSGIGGGQPLDRAVRRTFELGFGADFSDVRLHDDAASQRTALALGAEAFTIGRDIYFAPNRLSTDSMRGRELLAHELAHAVQQRRGDSTSGAQSGSSEQAAARAAGEVVHGRPATPLDATPTGVARQPGPSYDQIQMRIYQIQMELRMPVHPFRPMLEMELIALQARLNSSGGGGPARPEPKKEAPVDKATQARAAEDLANYIDSHPAWNFRGRSGSVEAYQEMEANTGGDDFVRSDLFREWYFKGWRAVGQRPKAATDLQELANHLIDDPSKRHEFLASVNLASGPASVTARPKSLAGPLDVSKMGDDDLRREMDAIRVWREQSGAKPSQAEQDRLNAAVTELTAEIGHRRGMASGATQATKVTGETFRKNTGAGPGFSGVSGPYGNVDIDRMVRGRRNTNSDDRPAYERWVLNGREVTQDQAGAYLASHKTLERVPLEPSIGADDRFVVLPEQHQFSDGTTLVREFWVVFTDKDHGKRERWRRMTIATHRGRIYPAGDDQDYGMGGGGTVIAGRMGGGPGGARVPGVKSGARQRGDADVMEGRVMPGRADMAVAREPKVVQRVGSRAVDADEVARIYQQAPTRVSHSTSTRWHQQVWENTGGKGPAPVAFQVGDMVRVDVERFGRTRNLADIGFHPDVPGYINPMGKTSPGGNGTMVSGQQPAVRVNIRRQQVDPMGQTGQAPAPQGNPGQRSNVDPMGQTGQAPAPQGNPGQRSNVDPMGQTGQAPQPQNAGARRSNVDPLGDTGQAPARPARAGATAANARDAATANDAIALFKSSPGRLSHSTSREFHQQVWINTGHSGDAPVAFRVGHMIRVDVTRWPQAQRHLIGL
jgi:hypothetical protein